MPPLVDPPHLFPAPAEGTTGRRPAHSKKKPDNHIPRPPNAFILFRSSFIKSQHVSTEVETNHSTLSKIIGLTWQNLPNEERQVWHGKAKAALEDHKKRFPSYAFRPAHTRGKGGTEKRKVREVGLKDVKRCEKIAELLVEGKKGEELDAAIQEFDRTHVPEIVTRFEAPLTVRTYRRSSSAPAAEPEAKPFLRPSESPRAKRVARSASTQPTRLASPAVDLPPIALPPSNFFQISMDAGFAPSDFSFDQKIEPASFVRAFYSSPHSQRLILAYRTSITSSWTRPLLPTMRHRPARRCTAASTHTRTRCTPVTRSRCLSALPSRSGSRHRPSTARRRRRICTPRRTVIHAPRCTPRTHLRPPTSAWTPSSISST